MDAGPCGRDPLPVQPPFRADWRAWLVLVMLLASLVRFSHLGHDSLSHDEAGRANNAWSATLGQMRWFPPLHYGLLWTVRHVLGPSEFAMRLPSALAGVACVVVLFLFTRRYVDAWSGVCVAAVAACHYELVTYSRLVKEFSIEALMCVVVTWAGVAAAQNPFRRRMVVFLVCGVFAFGLTYTAPLVVGAWLIVMGLRAAQHGADRRRRLMNLFVITALFAVVLTGWYGWLSGASNAAATTYGYGLLHGAWPASYGAVDLTVWFLARSYGALQYVLGITGLYAPINWVIGSYELLLAAAAAAILRRRLPSLCVASLFMLVLTVAVGAARRWPYGNFHTMMFLVPLACLAVGCGLRQMAGKIGWSSPTMLLVLVCVLNPAARAVKQTVFDPSETEHLRPVLQYVGRRAQPGDGLFAYYATGAAVRHYWKRDDIEVLTQPTDDRGHLPTFARRFSRFMADHRRVWFVFTHNWKNERAEWLAHLKQRYRMVDEFEAADASAYLFEPPRPTDRAGDSSPMDEATGIPGRRPGPVGAPAGPKALGDDAA